MEARIDVITLAVADLDRALAFYRVAGDSASATWSKAKLPSMPSWRRPRRLAQRSPRRRTIARGASTQATSADLDGHLWEVVWNPQDDDASA